MVSAACLLGRRSSNPYDPAYSRPSDAPHRHAVAPSSDAPRRHHPYHLAADRRPLHPSDAPDLTVTGARPFGAPSDAPRRLPSHPMVTGARPLGAPSDAPRCLPSHPMVTGARPLGAPRRFSSDPTLIGPAPSDPVPYNRPVPPSLPFGPYKPPRCFSSDPTIIPGAGAPSCHSSSHLPGNRIAGNGIVTNQSKEYTSCERITDESDMCNDFDIWNDPDIWRSIWNDSNMWNDKTTSKTMVWGGVFNDFTLFGAETLRSSTRNNWERVLGHYAKYWLLKQNFYVLTAGLCSISRACLCILAIHVLQHPGANLTVEGLAAVIQGNQDLNEMLEMANNNELSVSKEDFIATILIVQKGVSVGRVSICSERIGFSQADKQGAGHGYWLHGERYLRDLPRDSTEAEVFQAAYYGFVDAAQLDYSCGGEVRFFCMYHDDRLMRREVYRLPECHGRVPRNCTPYTHPNP